MNAKNILFIVVGYVIGIVGVVGAVQLAIHRNLEQLPPTPYTANTETVRWSLPLQGTMRTTQLQTTVSDAYLQWGAR